MESITREEDAFLRQFNAAAKRLYPGINANLRRPTDEEWLAADGGAEWTEEQLSVHTWMWRDDEMDRTHAVAQKPANARGIYESRGHVDSALEKLDGSSRVVRGGSWYYGARIARLALPDNVPPGGRYDDLGFRFVSGRP